MSLQQLLEEIEEICKTCIECDPCCTGNLLKKSIKNMRFSD